MSLREQAFSGIRWTTLSSLGRALLQVFQIAILARLLTPADFGLVAIVAALMAILQIFSDAGVSNAIIHYQDITPTELSSLYWLNVGISATLGLLLALASPWISLWYHEAELRPLFMIAALTLVIGALGQQARIVAQKNLRFADLAKVELGAALAGAAVAVALAVLGGGVYSLITGSLAAAATGALLAWVYLTKGWRPRLSVSVTEIRRFLRFGSYIIGNNLVNAFNSQVDVLLGGRLLGAQAIGLYSVPKDFSLRLAGIINPVVTQVSLPVMAKAQTDVTLLKKLYLRMMRMTASVSFPVYVALAVFPGEVVRVLLGGQWHSAVPLLRLLACSALLRSTGNPVGSLLMALGRPDLSFHWNLALLGIMAPAVWLGSQFGLIGMAIAIALVALLLYVPNWYFLVRPLCGAKFGEYTVQLAVPLGLSLASGLAGYFSAQLAVNDLARLAIGMLAGGAVYLGLSWRLNRTWADAMMELVGIKTKYARTMRPLKAAKPRDEPRGQ